MRRFMTYCDLPFLNRYFRARPDRDALEATPEDDAWRAVYRFLQNHTDLVINTTQEEVSPTLLQPFLAKGRWDGLRLDPTPFKDMEDPQFFERQVGPHTLFFIEQPPQPHEMMSQRYGLLFVRFSSLYATWEQIGHAATLNVSRNSSGRCLKSWDDLGSFNTPVTAVLICDKYLLSGHKSPEELALNLGALLLQLLPDGENLIPVDVSLVSGFEDLKSPALRPEAVRDWLEQYLHRQRPALAVNVSVAQPRTHGHHDRHIFTNYGFFVSGDTLNYFDSKGKLIKETLLDFKPMVDSNVFTIAREKLEAVATAALNDPLDYGYDPWTNLPGPTKLYAGNLKNRLVPES